MLHLGGAPIRRSLLRRVWRPDPGGKPPGPGLRQAGALPGCLSRHQHDNLFQPAGLTTAPGPPGTAGFQRVSQKGQLECSTLVEPPSGAACCAGLVARSRRQAAGAGAPASRSTPWPPQPASTRHPLPAGRRDAILRVGRLGSPASSRPTPHRPPRPAPGIAGIQPADATPASASAAWDRRHPAGRYLTGLRVRRLGTSPSSRPTPRRPVRPVPGIAGFQPADTSPPSASGAWDRRHPAGRHLAALCVRSPGSPASSRPTPRRPLRPAPGIASIQPADATPASASAAWDRRLPAGRHLAALRVRRLGPPASSRPEPRRPPRPAPGNVAFQPADAPPPSASGPRDRRLPAGRHLAALCVRRLGSPASSRPIPHRPLRRAPGIAGFQPADTSPPSASAAWDRRLPAGRRYAGLCVWRLGSPASRGCRIDAG